MYSIVAEESGLLPRERLLQKGAEVLSDQELLAIVLRTGTRSESVLSSDEFWSSACSCLSGDWAYA